jgi:hypothetical protein
MANSTLGFNVYIYVDPETQVVDSIHAYHTFGASVRLNADWVSMSQDELDENLADLAGDLVYSLDWSTDYTAAGDAADDDDSEHVAIELYDQDELTFDEVQKYAKLATEAEEADGIPDVTTDEESA